MLVLLILSLTVKFIDANCPTACSCQSVRVDCSRRGLFHVPRSFPQGIRSLDLSGNDIETVPSAPFKNIPSLTAVDLSDNRIRHIELDLFKHVNLTFLNLRKNRLSSIPSGLRVSERVDLGSNSLTSLTKEDAHLISTVPSVDLSRNRITHIHSSTPNIHSLIHTLDLASNSLRLLPDDIFSSFPHLISLRLARNRIISLSRNSFRPLAKLENLDLNRNQLSSVSSLTFETVPALKNLNLARNRITLLEDGVFFGCQGLKLLNISSNNIDEVAEGWLFGLFSLQTLDLSDNRVSSLDPAVWRQTPELRWLSLTGNRLTSLSSGAFRLLPRLEHLSLSSNKLHSLHKTSMTGLDGLHSLDLSDNQLAVCVEDGAVLHNTSLPYLRVLRFAKNGLRVVPGRAFARFPALQLLDLRENPIASLLPGAFEPLNLQSLFIATSSLLCDCHISWFGSWLYSAKVDRRDVLATCAHPPPLRDIPVINIDVANLTCEDDSPRARIVLYPSSQTTVAGDSATFHCHGYGHEPLEIEWRVIEEGRPRILDSDSSTFITRRRIDVFNGTYDGHVRIESTLELRDVSLSDSYHYQCVVSNQYAKEYSVRVELQVHKAPTLNKEPDDITLLVGQNAKISCSAVGQPPPVLRWSKDGGESFPAAIERRLHVRQGDDHLYVLNVTLADQGVYTCHASNSVGSIQASATLRVFENGFRSNLVDVEIREGESVLLECLADVTSNAHKRVIWTKDGTPLRDDGHFVFKAHNQILHIKKISSSDEGLYECQLWAGGDLLTQQKSTIKLISTVELAAKEGQQKSKDGLRSWLPVSMLATALLCFVVVGLIWVLIFTRRTITTTHPINTTSFIRSGDLQQSGSFCAQEVNL